VWHITPYSTHTVLAPCVSEHLSNVHNRPSNTQQGGVGPLTFQKVQPTLREGGVGPWSLKERIHYLGGAGGTK